MATPQSTTSHEGDGDKKDGQITFIFCDECSNMLYPKEDEDSRKLQLTCRTCHFTKAAESSCVFRNVLNNAAGETAGVTQDVGSDPTVGAPPSPNTVSSVSPHSKAVLCFCCGALIACRSCGVVFCKLASSPSETSATSAATTTTTTAASTDDTPTVSPSLRDLDDLDLYPYDYDFEDVTNTAGMFSENDCLDYDNDYEFMDGCEETVSALGNDAGKAFS
ncbi:DNA directed RNA polymerase 2 [Sporothrix brasiliensis 5110]|uniref:DNA directed RNA polymerase 2 n=1 Tax=Sporothrix brasiliensis 5110 TaxID=1398154 RepID=A0A0C2F0R8_9PEZI|nr:DNA directed RNA polymerase 2 [Sporothrix brasiliensis 5110]KIH92424.1 DNA directed RNA polymerase 2 [Sporothrix brasiliensis 5110]